MEKVKKPIWKKWWFWVLVVIVIGGIANSGEDSTQTTAQQAADQSEQQASGTEQAKEEKPTEQPKEQPKEEPKEPENKPTISKAEFDQIKVGMTYEEVVKIIGGEGELLSEAGEKGTLYHTVMYSWEGEGEIGANANLTFQGGKLQAKAQFGLK